jgi:hypothetical protein
MLIKKPWKQVDFFKRPLPFPEPESHVVRNQSRETETAAAPQNFHRNSFVRPEVTDLSFLGSAGNPKAAPEVRKPYSANPASTSSEDSFETSIDDDTMDTRGQCYKTFYGRKLEFFILS